MVKIISDSHLNIAKVQVINFPQLTSRVDLRKTTVENLEALGGYFVPTWDSSTMRIHDRAHGTRTQDLRFRA